MVVTDGIDAYPAGMAVSSNDITHLRRCVELAREALTAGDEPFGSVLVDRSGRPIFEDRNRISSGDHTRHPELTIVEWAVAHLSPTERAAASVYTSGEHCPMCAAAHAWVGLGRIVYAVSSAQLGAWREEWNAPESPVAGLPINDVAPALRVEGPVDIFADEMKTMHRSSVDAT
ncbi:tRNA(Arg) A34 adenosine deaminase TadA [Williamsia maris]|uniref:tRNA(Arg) A34 adenosine deaminase TadA n=2 Tax=Williamsia maris TaxID=72806 RepID=A0ABT1HJ82_9NOCA|nr:tRNA(Arg) A34 adenosine deaminase TadA [Williamsia maris]